MATYDEKIIQQFADDLYKQAEAIIAGTAVRYAAAALIAGYAVSMVITHVFEQQFPSFPGEVVTLGIAVVGLLLGILKGRARAFSLRLQAQQVLLQMQIERNTRKNVGV
jgi:uncharacterized integral membrane protein